MAGKITDYPAGTGLKDTDIVDVSVDNGDGTFTTKSFTVAQVKAIAENLANTNLTQTETTRQYDIVATQLLEFLNGNLKITRDANNYVHWQGGVLFVRGGDGDIPKIFEVVDGANAQQFNVTQNQTEIFNTPKMSLVAENAFNYELGLNGDEVVKRTTGTILYKARIEQIDAGVPVITEYINNTGLTISASYVSTGKYTLSDFNGQLTGNLELTMSDGMPEGSTATLTVDSNNIIEIDTYNAAGTLENGLLPYDGVDATSLKYCVLTVIKY